MRAIVYHACCQPKYVGWASISAESAKKHMPDVETVLLTEMAVDEGFDRIVQVASVPLALAHLPPLQKFPDYDSGIYLDCDSYVCAPLYDVFDLVEDDRIDMALIPARHRDREPNSYIYPGAGDIPAAYPQFGSAFIAFQNNIKVRKFFGLWSRLFHEHQQKYHEESPWLDGHFQDEPSLRVAFYHSDLTCVPLPPKYHLLDGVVLHGVVRSFRVRPKGTRRKKVARMGRTINCHLGDMRLVLQGQEYLLKDIQLK